MFIVVDIYKLLGFTISFKNETVKRKINFNKISDVRDDFRKENESMFRIRLIKNEVFLTEALLYKTDSLLLAGNRRKVD